MGLAAFLGFGQADPSPSVEEVKPLIEEAIKAAKLQLYREALADGVKMTLELLLGEGKMADELPTSTYSGPVPEELREWACDAKCRIEEGGWQ